jgi:hypothetical protein
MLVVTLSRFTASSDPAAFRDYLRIKYDVFVNEKSWVLPADELLCECIEETDDRGSSFVLARAELDLRAIGVLRGTVTASTFPHKELFSHHFASAPLNRLSPDLIASLNSLAVLPAFRRLPVSVHGLSQPLTTSRALVIDMLDWLRLQGVLLVVASALPIASARLFAGLGFSAMDAFQGFGSDNRLILNMGRALPILNEQSGLSSEKRSESNAIINDLSKYLASRHSAVTQGREFVSFVSESIANVQPNRLS